LTSTEIVTLLSAEVGVIKKQFEV